MGIYERLILPRLIHLGCGSSPVPKQRLKIVPLASGRVLDVGAGSGHNLPLYEPERVQLVWGLEPNHGMRDLAADRGLHLLEIGRASCRERVSLSV